MSIAIHFTATVAPDGKIEITAPELKPGMTANITVTIDVKPQQKRGALEILADMPGHQLFQTAEEVDDYIRAEREAWEQ